MGFASYSINEVRIGAQLLGDARKGNLTLVLLHGFMGSARNWLPHDAAFSAADLRVIALDMLGHGSSASPYLAERYSIEHACDDILAVLQRIGIGAGEAVLLGYSMGGRIALYTAFSGYFRGLVLESASPGIADEAEREQRRRSDNELADRIEREGIPAFVEYWENLPLFASQRSLPDAVQSEVRAGRLRNNPRGLANSLRGVGTGAQPSLHRALKNLDIPTLLIAGALDAKFTAIAREMAAQLPQAQLAIVPDAGHTVHLEQPRVFDALVIEFCNSITSTR